MTFLMYQSHRLLPGLDVISLLTDTLRVLILPFPGKNKVMVRKHDIDTHALRLSQTIGLQRTIPFGWYHSLEIQTVWEDKLLLLHA